ncbi:MAG: hypothetical protein M1820_007575 [Bogoriella megaspora]|nr:MAG: hypothetical protein M1820_007575 [Bogoriella megaspora]
MYTSLAFATFLTAAIAQSSSGPITTSIVFDSSDKIGPLDASIIGFDSGSTTMALACPSGSNSSMGSLKQRDIPTSATNPLNSKSKSAIPTTTGSGCPLNGIDIPYITVTVGPQSGSSTVVDVAVTYSTSIDNPQYTVSAGYSLSEHCTYSGTTAGACTVLQGVPVLAEASRTTSRSTSSNATTSTLQPSDIVMQQIIITAGQEKLASATSSASSSSSSAGAVGNNVGMGVVGSMMMGVLGFAIGL